jgi:hypothetical protein
MTNEEFQQWRRHAAARAWLYGVLGAALAFSVGLVLKGYLCDREQAQEQRSATLDRDHERAVWNVEKDHLNQIIEDERKRHADQVRQRDIHLSSFTARSVRVRNELETLLDASHRDADACTGRIAAISEDVGELGELLGRGVELLEKGQIEVSRLRAENERLAGQVEFWQRRYGDSNQRITVTAKRKAE